MRRLLWFCVGVCVGRAVWVPPGEAVHWWGAAVILTTVGAAWTVRDAADGTGGGR